MVEKVSKWGIMRGKGTFIFDVKAVFCAYFNAQLRMLFGSAQRVLVVGVRGCVIKYLCKGRKEYLCAQTWLFHQ